MQSTIEQRDSGTKDPVVLSYNALRRAVGIVACALPFLVSIPARLFCHQVEGSISAYYYTCMRDVFVGCLCAISMFMLCCRGYDRRDVIASEFSAVCALGVAFFPCRGLEKVHYACAALLFATLAYFCLVLFRLSSGRVTRRKVQRNRVYAICGIGIVLSMAIMAIHALLTRNAPAPVPPHVARFTFIFETTSLLCFGVAWLVKGQTFLQDLPGDSAPAHTRTTSKLFSTDIDPDPDPTHPPG